MLEVLSRQRDNSLVLVHDAPSSRIPWEVLRISAPVAWSPAIYTARTRLYTTDNLSIAKWMQSRVTNHLLEILLVINPIGDLDGAAREGKAKYDLLSSKLNVLIEKLE